MKKTILIPAGIAEKIIHFKPENRLLSAIGQFSPERRNFWHPVQSYYLTNASARRTHFSASFASLCCTANRQCAVSARPIPMRVSRISGARLTILHTSAW